MGVSTLGTIILVFESTEDPFSLKPVSQSPPPLSCFLMEIHFCEDIGIGFSFGLVPSANCQPVSDRNPRGFLQRPFGHNKKKSLSQSNAPDREKIAQSESPDANIETCFNTAKVQIKKRQTNSF